MAIMKRELLSVHEVAQKLGVSRWTVYRWRNSFPELFIVLPPGEGKKRPILRIRATDLEKFLEERRLCTND